MAITASQATVATYLGRRDSLSSQTWRTFLTNQIGQLVSVDFFVVPTPARRVLCVFIVLAHEHAGSFRSM